jgi:hypothetical protein
VRERRANRSRSEPAPGVIAVIGAGLWTKAARSPVDFAAILAATAASLIIVVNAVFLQSGSHPAPFFAVPAPLAKPVEQHAEAPVVPAKLPEPPARPATAARTPQPASMRHSDPIGDLIGSPTAASPTRIVAVQRVLSQYGYGPVRASGILDESTSTAIAKFEADRTLPVTGRLSDRLLSELAVLAGHPVE